MSHSQLFGEDEDAVGELDAAEQQGENGNQFRLIRSNCSVYVA